MPRKIILVGATGLIGEYLYWELKHLGDEVIIFTRNPGEAVKILPGAKMYVEFNLSKPDKWESIVNGNYAVIHLAGARIGGVRWSEKNKKEIIVSRISTTRALINAINKADEKPEVLICASAIGYYGASDSAIFTETSPSGNDFLANVCRQWKDAATKVENKG